jgi:hypothetical protein
MIAGEKLDGARYAFNRREALNRAIEINELRRNLTPKLSRPQSRELCLDVHALMQPL